MNKIKVLRRVRPYTIITDTKLSAIYDICCNMRITNDILEVGVYKGGIGLLFANMFPRSSVLLCDTFTGIPYSDSNDTFHGKGDFADITLIQINKLFVGYPNVHILPGIFPDDTWKMINDRLFSIVHLDMDVYKAYKDSLNVLWDKVVQGGIIFLDDYMEPSTPGATKAIDEFMINKIEKIELRDEQYFIRKI